MQKMRIWSLTIGNVLEWYDYAIYGALAPIIALVFFPNYSPTTAILLTLMVFAIGFLCRPFGAIIFGHIADKHGRRPAFLMSVLLMVFPTLIIAILPTYKSVGVLAPLLLMFCRLLQGIAIGGEYPTAASYIYETAPQGKRGLWGSLLNVSTVIGVVCATLVIVIFNHLFSTAAMHSFGWRIAFLLTAVSSMFSFYLRTRLNETPDFTKLIEDKANAVAPLKNVITNNKIIIIQLFFYLICAAVVYYSYNIYTVSFLKTQAHFSYNQALLISLFSSIVLAVLIPCAGKFSDMLGRKSITIIALIGFIILSRALYSLILSGHLWAVLLGQLVFGFMLALYLGALPSYICEQTNTKLRVSTIAIGYNLSLTIFGGTAPMINMLLIRSSHSAYAPSYYLTLTATVFLVAILTMKKRSNA